MKQDGLRVFAGRPGSGGRLRFGVSVWSPSGQNISVFGVAAGKGAGQGTGWVFEETADAPDPADRCRLSIDRDSAGALRVVADPAAACQSHGGVNAAIGTLLFPSSALEGPVNAELDDAEAFQKAGHCAR